MVGLKYKAYDAADYLAPRTDGRLWTGDELADPRAQLMHDQLRGLIMFEGYPCMGAKSVFNRLTYRMGIYDRINLKAAQHLHKHLVQFTEDYPEPGAGPRAFVAAFLHPVEISEKSMDKQLWRLLQQLHDIDVEQYPWDPAVSSDLKDRRFSYSVAAQAWFVVSLQPGSSRVARRLPFVAISFNPHSEFERLRGIGRYSLMRDHIRNRDAKLQGSYNPNVTDFGESSEAWQYSSLAKDENYAPPFCPHMHRPKSED